MKKESIVLIFWKNSFFMPQIKIDRMDVKWHAVFFYWEQKSDTSNIALMETFVDGIGIVGNVVHIM